MHQAGQDGRDGKHLAGEIDLAHQVSIPCHAVDRCHHRPDTKVPRQDSDEDKDREVGDVAGEEDLEDDAEHQHEKKRI